MRTLGQIAVTTGWVLFRQDAIHMRLDIFGDVVVKILPYCAPTNESHLLKVEEVYWKYIVNMLIDSIM